MSDVRTYNGWSNYETWLAFVWISNDERGCKLLESLKCHDDKAHENAELLKSYYDIDLRLSLDYDKVFSEAGLLTDLLRAAFAKVNWVEIVLEQ